MPLEDLLKPIKFVKRYTWDLADEFALIQYTKLTRNLEARGINRYAIAGAFDLANIATFFSIPIALQASGHLDHFVSFMNSSPKYIKTLGGILKPFYYLSLIHDIFDTTWGLISHKDYTSGAIAENKLSYISRSIQRVTRLPLLAYGCYGLYYLTQRSLHGNFDYFNYLILSNVILCGSLASSMYTKDSNPKLLDKQPIWKEAFNLVKDKVKSLVPTPAPQPVPSESYSGLSVPTQT